MVLCTKICFLSMRFITCRYYLSVSWRTMLNIHFPVLTNFVMCVYLNVFNSILFQWIFIISFNFCATLMWLFMRDISKASWISRHRHLGTSSSIAKILFFPYETILKKKVEYLCPIHLNIFLLISLGSLMHRFRGAAWDDIKILRTSQANSL